MAASFLLILLTLSHLHLALPTGNNHFTDRKSLEIIIGGGGDDGDQPPSPSPELEPEDCPPPPPEDCPPPPPEPPCPPPPLPPMHSPPPPPPPPKKHNPPKLHYPPPPAPPPPPRKSEPPLLFESQLLKEAYPVLQRFRNLVEHPKGILDSWKGGNICRDYVAIKCAMFPHKNQRAIQRIRFNGFNMSGKYLRLDNFLDKLPTVSIFQANSNFFIGSVPKLTDLQYLFELDLSNNKLSGEFPDTVTKATNLTVLDLRFNNFEGSVPPLVFNLDLDVLFINNNNLVQRLPRNLGSITALYLTFANNRFTGPIPASIGDIKTLLEVLFLNNQLTGCLPYQIGMLNRATVFDVGCNKLTGPIPYSFGCLHKMEQLNLAQNHFYGTIPETVCELSCLKNLSLSYNYFTQVGPKCRELIKKNILDVRMNCILDLPNQRTPSECTSFFLRKQSCSDPNSMFIIPCGKNPNQATKPDQYRLQHEGHQTQVSPPLSYGSLNPDRIRNL